MSVTLKQVVDASGYSLPTVSRILSGKGNHRAETVNAVMSAAKKLGYRANQGARAMKTGRFEALTLLQLKHAGVNPLPKSTLYGIRDELAKENKSLIFASIFEDENGDYQLPRSIRDTMTDGLMISSHPELSDGMMKIVEEAGLPAVWVNAKIDTDAIRPDDEGAGVAAVEQLVEQGHKHIVYANYGFYYPTAHYSCSDRYAGYEKAMLKHGLTPKLVCTPPGPYSSKDRIAVARNWINEVPNATAYVTYGDEEALALIWVLTTEFQKKVPDDVSIVNFSDAIGLSPVPFSGMLNPAREVGCLAVQRLLKKIETPALTMPADIIPFTVQEGSTLAKIK